ncbi:hypothetical protein B0H10DRAFT_1326932 [Mycena sp. CBHHK59/15]|nr:hypothetical protein B0H10DRAFT_1326932 [Mycena sp. CBHHK59/15]
MFRVLLLAPGLFTVVFSSPFGLDTLQTRASADNVVFITDTQKFCMIMPRSPHTNIGDSERPGGTRTHCSRDAHYDAEQGDIPATFWSNVAFKKGTGQNGQRYIQLTGCIRPEQLGQLNPDDGGGQYDSSGGSAGRGNPEGSVCLGYNHYVEIVEPDARRACIRCCDDAADCPTNKDTQGCLNVIPGTYDNCN